MLQYIYTEYTRIYTTTYIVNFSITACVTWPRTSWRRSWASSRQPGHRCQRGTAAPHPIRLYWVCGNGESPPPSEQVWSLIEKLCFPRCLFVFANFIHVHWGDPVWNSALCFTLDHYNEASCLFSRISSHVANFIGIYMSDVLPLGWYYFLHSLLIDLNLIFYVYTKLELINKKRRK
jgi:hypothetical protein